MKEAVFHGVKQLASEFSKEMAQLVKIFPKHERFSLADDLLRAARSVPANISEGWGRMFPKEKVSFYNISNGSAEECANHLIEAHNNGYIDKKTNELYQKKLHIITVKLTNLIMSTRKRIKSTAKHARNMP
jgi:four helix bundle protein